MSKSLTLEQEVAEEEKRNKEQREKEEELKNQADALEHYMSTYGHAMGIVKWLDAGKGW